MSFTIAIVALALFRFLNLDGVPVFGDEANHLMQASFIWQNPASLGNLVSGGIMPGLIVVLSVLEKLTPSFLNILVVARAFSVICDLVSAYFLYLLGKKLFDVNTGKLSAFVYLTLPLNFFHGRVVMLEAMMSTFFLTALYLTVKLIDKPSLKRYLGVFILLTLSFLVKPLMLVSLPALVVLPFVFGKKKVFPLLLGGLVLVFLVSLPLISLSGNHFFTDYFLRNSGVLWLNFKTNLFRTLIWLKVYYLLPVSLFALLTFTWGAIKKKVLLLWLAFWAGSVIILDCLVGGKLFYPRHLFPLGFPLSLASGYFLAFIFKQKRLWLKIVVVISLLLSLWPIILMAVSPTKAKLVPEDRTQFFEDWTSGVGLKELAGDLRQLSAEKEILVYVGDEPLLTWALPHIYGVGRAKLAIVAKNYRGGKISSEIQSTIKYQNNAYLVLNWYPYPSEGLRVNLVKEYSKGPNRELKLFRILP
jgi:hypothetical protein